MDMDCSSMVISCKLTWQVFYILAARVIMHGQVCNHRETCSLPKTDWCCLFSAQHSLMLVLIYKGFMNVAGWSSSSSSSCHDFWCLACILRNTYYDRGEQLHRISTFTSLRPVKMPFLTFVDFSLSRYIFFSSSILIYDYIVQNIVKYR